MKDREKIKICQKHFIFLKFVLYYISYEMKIRMENFVSKNKSLFSTSISGFKKSEVVEYLEELNRKSKMEREAAEYERNSLASENNSLSEENEALKDKVAEFERNAKEFEEMKTKLGELEENLSFKDEELKLLKDDVATQREIIASVQNENGELKSKLSESEKIRALCEEKANSYENDKLEAGGVLEKARAEAQSIISKARTDADAIVFNARTEAEIKVNTMLAESEKDLAENVKKIKYLQKRKAEMLSAFAKVKEAAGGFYDNIASVILKDSEE